MTVNIYKEIAGGSGRRQPRALTTPSVQSSDTSTQQIGPALQNEVFILNVTSVPATSITVRRGISSGSFLTGNITMIEEATGNKVTAITVTGNYILSPDSGYPSFGPYFLLTQNGAGVCVYGALLGYPLGD